MKPNRLSTTLCALLLFAAGSTAAGASEAPGRLFMDVHELEAVTASDVADAHMKDLAVQDEYGVSFIRYWVDEENARVYCLAEAPDARSVSEAHAKAHGLVPRHVHEVTAGVEDPAPGKRSFFLDVHEMGAGKVTVDDVARAHEKDLAVQKKHGVHFINYWVDPRAGKIFCLSEAPGADAVLAAHREAHGLVSDLVSEVVQGE